MKKILEIGSGQGFHVYTLSKVKNNRVIGIDLSKNDIKISQERYPGIDFKYMNAEKLEFKKNYFDIVYALDVLEHVDHLYKVIREVNRVLKINGKFIIKVPHPKTEEWLLKMRPTYFKEIHHVRVFTDYTMEKVLLKNGFKLMKKQNVGFLQHIEFYFLFKRKIVSNNQTSIGSWRDSNLTKILHVAILYTNKDVLNTQLKYLPIWVVTLPIGVLIDYLGAKVFPMSQYYEFRKIIS